LLEAHRHRIIERLYEAAADVGRLRTGLDPEPGGTLDWRLDRISGHIEALLSFFEPTAAELVACTHPDDPDAIAAALDHVDARHSQLRHALGYRKRAAA
jgi:hypothetical protein